MGLPGAWDELDTINDPVKRVKEGSIVVTTTETLEAKQVYASLTARKVLFILVGLTGCVSLVLVAVSLGAAELGVGTVASAIASRIFPFLDLEIATQIDVIVWDIRLPRIVMGIIAGAGLAIAGASMQGIMRNPLVSPFTIGIASGAAFGASIAIVLGLGMVGGEKYMIITNAFFFALLAGFLVYGLAKVRGMRPETLILAGIALSFFFSAATSLLQFIATEEELAVVIHWLFGSLAGAGWGDILIVLIVFCFALPFLIKYSWDFNAMVAGDEVAASLGVNTRRVRIVSMAMATLIAAVIICFTGIIGFIGLVAPHITRMIIGADHRFLLPFSCILGSLLLVGADTVGRTAFQPVVIPVGIMISVIGVPFFLYLILKTKREYFQ
ncbi:iron ABC transporter permease [Dehalococcoidia bacterium]|nr:iron ABC transporter permease [Dehalococcoidia bacterium]